MSLLWVCQMTPTKEIRHGVHLAFRWNESDPIETACGIELDGERIEWVNAEYVVSTTRPALPLCPDCAAMTVAEVEAQHGRWLRGEPR